MKLSYSFNPMLPLRQVSQMPQRATLDGKFEEAYRAERSAPSRVLVCCSLRRCLRGIGISAHAAAATLTVSLALALTGCSTPVLKSSVDVPGQYAASLR